MKFIESEHAYIAAGGEPYISVTTLLHKLEPKKDWDKIAKTYAKKHKKPLEEVQKLWKEENQKSLVRGTSYHQLREKQLLQAGRVYVDDVELEVFPSYMDQGIKLARPLKLDDGIYPEILVWLDSARLAGSPDYVEVHNGKINIEDYKTNKEIKIRGFVNWEGVEAKLLQPVAHMPECNYSLYCLQINMYMYMLLKHNPTLKMGRMVIKHIIFDEERNTQAEKLYQVPDLQKEVKNIIELHKANKLK